MTINEALARCTDITGDSVSRELMIKWLWEIENIIYRSVLKTHEGGDGYACPCFDNTDGESVLLVPDPESELYILYLTMASYYHFGDTDQYNNASSAFAAAFKGFSDRYNREHLPIGSGSIQL